MAVFLTFVVPPFSIHILIEADSLTLLHPDQILIRIDRASDKENQPDCSEREKEELHPENVPPVGFGISAPDVHFVRNNAPASRSQPSKELVGREKDWIFVRMNG